jgi:tRNA(Phe) wybutosine-synthesizing methylase Tyw3
MQDLAVFQYMKAAEHYFKDAYLTLISNAPLLHIHVQNIEARPKIKA